MPDRRLNGSRRGSPRLPTTVDLLFFPTGGGKTEAYLGLAATAIVLRRVLSRDAKGKPTAQECGVSVLMRYTLRLLTLDQLGRAAGLVCALELKRKAAPDRLGDWPFEIGLWVGSAATPNTMGGPNDKSPGRPSSSPPWTSSPPCRGPGGPGRSSARSSGATGAGSTARNCGSWQRTCRLTMRPAHAARGDARPPDRPPLAA